VGKLKKIQVSAAHRRKTKRVNFQTTREGGGGKGHTGNRKGNTTGTGVSGEVEGPKGGPWPRRRKKEGRERGNWGQMRKQGMSKKPQLMVSEPWKTARRWMSETNIKSVRKKKKEGKNHAAKRACCHSVTVRKGGQKARPPGAAKYKFSWDWRNG